MSTRSMSTRTITLELLRQGPANNQLLSPITQYLALCENHRAQTIQLSFDHADYQSRLEGLRYHQTDEMFRGVALREATRDVTRIFAAVPALPGELTAARDAELVHLRLVLSAAELAALPFELAEAPPGAPSEGQRLFLEACPPVVITRETRRVRRVRVPWPRRPRILFAFAAPGDLPPIPANAHVLALRRALDPWIGWMQGANAATAISKHLTLLPNASLDAIADACREALTDGGGPYTHVHILAHGIARPAPGSREARFYLAMHAAPGAIEVEYVDGRRLEAALRPVDACRDALAVVTVASCDGGNGGSVVAGGASVAHELHEAGVPFVVASQFPLTFRGSAILADRLYVSLLWGVDPRRAVHLVRRELYANEGGTTHDWASVVAYATLPDDLDDQLADVKYHRTRKAGDVALTRVWHALDKYWALDPERSAREARVAERRSEEGESDASDRPASTSPAPTSPLRDNKILHADDLDAAVREMLLLTLTDPRAHGWLGSIGVRWTEVLNENAGNQLEPGHRHILGDAERNRFSHTGIDEALRFAADHYRKVFDQDPDRVWGLVQSVVLNWVIRTRGGEPSTLAEDGWCAATWLSEQALKSCDPVVRAGAADSLAQLYLLAIALPPDNPGFLTPSVAAEKVRAMLEQLLASAGPHSSLAFATRRQMIRFAGRWSESVDADSTPELLVASRAAIAIKYLALKMDKLLASRDVPEMWYDR
jgi:hypothetical protein